MRKGLLDLELKILNNLCIVMELFCIYYFTMNILQMLDENSQLIQAIVDYQNKGKSGECHQ